MTPEAALLAVRVLLTVVLYGFLGLLLWTQWADLRASRRRRERAPAARLLAVDGPLAAAIFPLSQVNDIGRAADNTIRLDDETVSSHHARVLFQSGQWWLEDLASRNGTSVNGLRVEEPLVITYGDELSFGRVRVRLEDGLEPPADGAESGGG
jgi:FHA domain